MGENKVGTAYHLSDTEYNALQKIAGATGMDCWFHLEDTGNGDSVIFDLESDESTNKPMNFKEGIDLLNQGIVDIDFLPDVEKQAYKSLIEKLGLWKEKNNDGLEQNRRI